MACYGETAELVALIGKATGQIHVTTSNNASPADVTLPGPSAHLLVEAPAGEVTVTVRDDSGEMVYATLTVAQPLPFVAHMWAEHVENRSWHEYDLHAHTHNGVPPYFPIWNDIRDPFFGSMHVVGVPAGKYEVIVMDSHDCVSRVSMTLLEHKPEMCPELYECQKLIEHHHSYYVQCLRKVAYPLLWNTDNWDLCRARAALDVIRAMHVPYNRDHGELTEVVGAASMALVLGDALLKCERRFGAEHCNFPWRYLNMFFREIPKALEYFQRRMFDHAWYELLGLPYGSQTKVLILAPYGYNNDPVSAPMMALPLGVPVTVLVIDGKEFPSDGVQCGRFPWTVQVDVNFAALYLRYAMHYLKPDWVFPSDNGGILMIGRLGSRLDNDSPLRSAFERSVGWPVQYPPPWLSKLFPGHENFATQEIVVMDNDGLTNIDVDLTALSEAYKKMGSKVVVIKREHSEDSLGVRFASSWNRLQRNLRSLMPRQEGIGMMDLEIKTRLFLQEPLDNCRVSYGARFFAQAGRVLAMALSEVVNFSAKLTYHYRTFRDSVFEQRVRALVREANITGFVTSWWCKSPRPEKYFLIDFNARIERHACLVGVLGEERQHLDPCYAFQEIASGLRTVEDFPEPLVVPANITYYDPIRMSWIKRPWSVEESDKRNWNIMHSDLKLAAFVDEMVPDYVRERHLHSLQDEL